MGAREDAIKMVDLVGRADALSLQFRHDVGLDGGEERAYGMARAQAYDGPSPKGLQIADVDQLLRQHESEGYHHGYQKGAEDAGAALDVQHRDELGRYVGAVCDLVSRELLAAVVTAAVKALDAKAATRQSIVDAVISQVKREAGALDDMAERARRGELFS